MTYHSDMSCLRSFVFKAQSLRPERCYFSKQPGKKASEGFLNIFLICKNAFLQFSTIVAVFKL